MGHWTASRVAMLIAALAISLSCSVHPSLAESACASEATLRSVAGTKPTEITFRNERPGVVNIFWIDYDGRRHFYRSLERGETQSLNTYATHPWVATDANGNCLGVYIADVGANNVTIRKEGGSQQ